MTAPYNGLQQALGLLTSIGAGDRTAFEAGLQRAAATDGGTELANGLLSLTMGLLSRVARHEDTTPIDLINAMAVDLLIDEIQPEM